MFVLLPFSTVFLSHIIFILSFTCVLTMSSRSKRPKKDKEPVVKPVQHVKITYPSDEEHWKKELPVEHGQFFLLNF